MRLRPEILRAKARLYLQLQDRTYELESRASELHVAQLQLACENEDKATLREHELVAMLGHELRNPLASMVSALEIVKLRGGGLTRELTVLDRQVTHLAHIVEDLVDVSRVTQGREVPYRG